MEERNSYFTSAPFKFIVEGQPFYAHSGLIAHVSKPLDRLINLEMKEKQQGYAVLEDVTAATFDRFLEWASKGHYTPPLPSEDLKCEEETEDHSERKSEELVPERVDNTVEETNPRPRTPPVIQAFGVQPAEPVPEMVVTDEERIDNGWGGFGPSLGSKKGKKKPWKTSSLGNEESTSRRRENMREAFHSRRPVVGRSHINIPSPRKNLNKSENYTEVFLCHARLYVFADLHDIQELKVLVLDELRALLAIFDLYQERTGDVVSLLRYAYASSGQSSSGESLRGILTEFVGIEMDVLMRDREFREAMLENGGDMLEDFMSVVMKRIRP
ncbi:MAG: hypothetical protein OHK93_003759 [Ramalina farinacea]|uniref:BTB domain-containing protein n=1 Tax=Ramalina farinacea TaxID=258253 RepID=A0AA43QYC2_9LECA|nr:hypothetical protein [Ramalina farinacea]